MTGGVLALDQATTVGWAYADPGDARPQYGHQRMGRVGATAGQVGLAFLVFLRARLDLFKPKCVCYESPWVPIPRMRVVRAGTIMPPPTSPPMNADTMRRLMGLPMLIETECEQWGIECREATPHEIAKFFLGTAGLKRAEKKARTIGMCKMMGWDATEDEADALALLCFAEARLFPQAAMRRPAGPLFVKSS